MNPFIPRRAPANHVACLARETTSGLPTYLAIALSKSRLALSIYVIHWHAEEWCRVTTDSLLASSFPVAITVLNNGGNPILDPRVRRIDLVENLGFTGAANWGLAEWLAGTEPFCMIAAHDLVVEEDAIQEIVSSAVINPDFGVLGMNDGTIGARSTKPQSGRDVWEIDWVAGASMLLRRDCILDVGLFDERLQSYGEDVDICLRARLAGWRVGAASASRASTLGSIAQDRGIRIIANRLLLAKKHGGRRGELKEYARLAWVASRCLGPSLFPGGIGRRRRRLLREVFQGLAMALPRRHLF